MMYPRTKREKSCSAALQAMTFQGLGEADRRKMKLGCQKSSALHIWMILGDD